MMRYILLNGIILLLVGMVFLSSRPNRQFGYRVLQTVGVITLLTMIFDPLIVAVGIVDYNRVFTLGLQIGRAPVEDLAYALAAGLLIPSLWKWYEKN